jgi:hypothetical protein
VQKTEPAAVMRWPSSIHHPVASIVQPVRRLQGFQRVTLAPGQTKTVKFTVSRNNVDFFDKQLQVRGRVRNDRDLHRREFERTPREIFQRSRRPLGETGSIKDVAVGYLLTNLCALTAHVHFPVELRSEASR